MNKRRIIVVAIQETRQPAKLALYGPTPLDNFSIETAQIQSHCSDGHMGKIGAVAVPGLVVGCVLQALSLDI